MKINGQQVPEIEDFSALDQFLSQHNLHTSPEVIKQVRSSLTCAFGWNNYLRGEARGAHYIVSEKIDKFLRHAIDILENSPQEHLGGVSYRVAINEASRIEIKNYLIDTEDPIEVITQDELDNALQGIIADEKAERDRMDKVLSSMVD